jgi:predicted RNA-binding Zn-ribbon protein involved in translation (DUF1610 family)
MLWMALLLIALGVVGSAVGLHGRVVRRELHCRSCGYVVDHLERSPQTICPECGNNLWLGAVTRKVRAHRSGLIRASHLTLYCALIPLALVGLERFTSFQWRQFYRTSWLISGVEQTTSLNPAERDWAELNRRRMKSALSDEENADVSAIALDRHVTMLRHEIEAAAHDHRPVNLPGLQSEHAQWIQAACSQGWISHEHVGAYIESMFRPAVRIHIPPTVSADQNIELRCQVNAEGIGAWQSVEVAVRIESIAVDGRAVELAVGDSLVYPMRIVFSGPRVAELTIPLSITLPLGTHDLGIQYRYAIAHAVIPAGSAGITFGRPLSTPNQWPPTICEWQDQKTFRIEAQ